MKKSPLFFLIAGEASGDLLGASLIEGLKKKTKGRVRIAGIGGARMKKAGLKKPIFSQAELAHFGLFELLTHIPNILRRIKETQDAIRKLKPDAVISIDAPDFCFRVVRGIRDTGIKCIHYVAPTVWAWRPKRAKKIAKFLDYLLVLLPFEPPYFLTEGLETRFVGHPIVESGADAGNGARFRKKYNIKNNQEIIILLPGSRHGEIKTLLPVFERTAYLLQNKNRVLVIPTLPSIAPMIRRVTKDWNLKVIITTGDGDKYDAMNAAKVKGAALACSGTVALELAMAGLPSVIVYKINWLTYFLYRRLIRVRYANLVNIMHDREIVPELLQDKCLPELIAPALENILTHKGNREEQIKGLKKVAHWLGAGQFKPSLRAAETVLNVIGGKK